MEMSNKFKSKEKANYYDEQDSVTNLIAKTKEILSKTLVSSVAPRTKGNFLKNIVSKKKNRFDIDGFDLDLSYITPNIIAMGFPAINMEKFYRNSMTDVQEFFQKRHINNYKVYNLCAERNYPENSFQLQCCYPFSDHEAPPFHILLEFCKDVEQWLDDPNHIAAIHCKAGKGRTGTMICCYLIYSKIVKSADDALNFYGVMRTENGKGVTIPSQIRYIYYFEHLLKGGLTYPINELPIIKISKIKMITIPRFHILKAGCTPYFSIISNETNYEWKSENSKFQSFNDNLSFVEFAVPNIEVSGDVRIEFMHKGSMGKVKMCKLTINTFFLPNDGVFTAKKSMLDYAVKDIENKQFDSKFKLEIHYVFVDKNNKILDFSPFS